MCGVGCVVGGGVVLCVVDVVGIVCVFVYD